MTRLGRFAPAASGTGRAAREVARMTFIHGYLLAGLVLAGLPILVHLVMRQKPRQLYFPAFRFLKRRLHVNRRRLRLQHLFLLLLRIGVIAALCLALVRPRIESSAV